jgi:hypothetical protein
MLLPKASEKIKCLSTCRCQRAHSDAVEDVRCLMAYEMLHLLPSMQGSASEQ